MTQIRSEPTGGSVGGSLFRRSGFARWVVSIGLMAWLLSKVDLNHVADQWLAINWMMLVVMVPPLHLLCVGLRSLRFKAILRGLGIRLPTWWLGLTQLKGVFLGMCLPGGISGDVYRAYIVSKTTGYGCESITAMLVEKVVGLASMAFMAMGSLVVGAYLMNHPVLVELERSLRWLWGGALTAALIAASVVCSGWGSSVTVAKKWPECARVLVQAIAVFKKGKTLGAVAIWSVLIQVSVVAWYFAISKATDFNLSFLILMLTVPIIEFILMLPVSVAGLGVRDLAFVILFTPFGPTVAEALSFSLLTFTVTALTKIASGSAFLIKPILERPGRGAESL